MDLSPETIAGYLNRLPFVRWDRTVSAPVEDGHSSVVVYGWVDRDDGRFDFVQLEFTSWSDEPGYSTSSAERSPEIQAILYGGERPHFPCERVEGVFGALVENAIPARGSAV